MFGLSLRALAQGVGVTTLYANVYLLHSPQGRLLVDTGTINYLPRFTQLLQCFNPDAVVVTHSHFDHSGNAFAAARLGYPVLAHPLEWERLCGLDNQLPYPAGKPRVGALIAGLHPHLRPHQLQAVQAGEDVLGWQVVPLPGHTNGQIGLLRDGLLVAADAVVSLPTGAHLPKAAYNWNHDEAFKTLQHIAQMDLRAIFPGHGSPLSPEQIQARVRRDLG